MRLEHKCTSSCLASLRCFGEVLEHYICELHQIASSGVASDMDEAKLRVLEGKSFLSSRGNRREHSNLTHSRAFLLHRAIAGRRVLSNDQTMRHFEFLIV